MNQPAELTWREGQVPVSQRFDDPYFSLENGLEETTYVFLDGNDLPARFRDGFHIAELGFGTGLNLLAALALGARAIKAENFISLVLKPSPWRPKICLPPKPLSPHSQHSVTSLHHTGPLAKLRFKRMIWSSPLFSVTLVKQSLI